MKLDFNKQDYDSIMEKCSFTDDEKKVIQLRRHGWSLSSIAAELYWSERTINRRISSISEKIIKVL